MFATREFLIHTRARGILISSHSVREGDGHSIFAEFGRMKFVMGLDYRSEQKYSRKMQLKNGQAAKIS